MCQSHIKENEKNKGNTYTAHGTQAHTAPWTKNLYNFVVSLGCFVIFGIVNKVKHVLVAFNFAYAFWILFRLMPFPFPSIPRLYSSITSIHCIHISKPSGASSMVCKMQCGTHQLINLYIFTRTRATLEWKDDDDDSNNKQKAATTTKTTIIRNGNGNKRRRRRKREKTHAPTYMRMYILREKFSQNKTSAKQIANKQHKNRWRRNEYWEAYEILMRILHVVQHGLYNLLFLLLWLYAPCAIFLFLLFAVVYQCHYQCDGV